MNHNLYPVQIQADNLDANGSFVKVMIHVFDIRSETEMYVLLSKTYRHVKSWGVNGDELYESDNR